MPVRRIIREDAKLGKTTQIIVMLGDKMGTGHLHMVGIAQLFFDDFNGIQSHTGSSLTSAMQVQVQSFLVELSKEIRKLFHIEGRDTGLPRIRVRSDQSRGMEGLCTVRILLYPSKQIKNGSGMSQNIQIHETNREKCRDGLQWHLDS